MEPQPTQTLQYAAPSLRDARRDDIERLLRTSRNCVLLGLIVPLFALGGVLGGLSAFTQPDLEAGHRPRAVLLVVYGLIATAACPVIDFVLIAAFVSIAQFIGRLI